MLASPTPFQAVDFAHRLRQKSTGKLQVEVHERAKNGRRGRKENLVSQLPGLWSCSEAIAVYRVIDILP